MEIFTVLSREEVHHPLHIPEEPGMDPQLGVASMHLPGRHIQETDLPPMTIEEHQPLEACLGQWFSNGLHLGQHGLCRLGEAHPEASVLWRKAKALQWQGPDGPLGREGLQHMVEHLLRKEAIGPQWQVGAVLFQAAPGHHDGAAVAGGGPLCLRPTEMVETTVLLRGHGKGNHQGQSIHNALSPSMSPMKAKDVKRPTDGDVSLSILKINKSEARQQTQGNSPPTESPPTPPSGSKAPLSSSTSSPATPGGHHAVDQDSGAPLPSFTPRSVDEVDFDEEAFQSALDGSANIGAKGEEVHGIVIGHESDGVYVDIGGKAPGWLPRQECGFGVITDVGERFPQGKPLKVLVTGEQNAEGMVTVSLRALMVRDSWATVTRLAEEAAVVQTVISGFNRGGCTCHVEGLRGFIPRSQLVEGDNHNALVGKTIGVTFLEVNPKTSKLVLSEKRASRAQRFAELQVGDLVTGRISGLKRFGCFVDLGPISGLLHQRFISARHVVDLREVFTVGESISALVTDVDAARGRIALNTALLENLPGEMLVAKAEVMAQAEQRAERARSALFQERKQDQGPGFSPQDPDGDQPAPPGPVHSTPARPDTPLPGDDSGA